MTDIVYVVVAHREFAYDDREEWICGVFADGAEARALAEAHTRTARAARDTLAEWRQLYRTAVPTISLEATMAWKEHLRPGGEPLCPEHRAEIDPYAAALAAFKREHGEEPLEPEANGFTVGAMRFGEWGRWEYHWHSDVTHIAEHVVELAAGGEWIARRP